MDYEKKYKEAQGWIEKIYPTLQHEQQMEAEAFFPELKESEDEKIRKDIIVLVKDWWDRVNKDNISTKEQMIAWLEKQGEQKASYTTIAETGNGGINALVTREVSNSCDYEEKPADKTEPKFKVGDWIVFNGLTLYINEVVQGYYRTISIGGIPNSYDWDIDNVARLWTIQDAKDGDVLCCESGWTCIFKTLVNDETFSSYCFMDKTKWFCETGCECHTLKEEFMKA